jgi:hypothetical protein
VKQPVSAWAVISKIDGSMTTFGGKYATFPTRKEALSFRIKSQEHVIPVLITPIIKKERKP